MVHLSGAIESSREPTCFAPTHYGSQSKECLDCTLSDWWKHDWKCKDSSFAIVVWLVLQHYATYMRESNICPQQKDGFSNNHSVTMPATFINVSSCEHHNPMVIDMKSTFQQCARYIRRPSVCRMFWNGIPRVAARNYALVSIWFVFTSTCSCPIPSIKKNI